MFLIANYAKQLENIINDITSRGEKPSLLLHCCCAPCSTYCIDFLHKHFKITTYFYNPNMDSQEEYNKRLRELKKFLQAKHSDITVLEDGYDNEAFNEIAKGKELCREGGERCLSCYHLRLQRTAIIAKKRNCDYFASTLSISPLKNSNKLNQIGQAIAQIHNIKHLPNDFKKNNGYAISCQISRQYNLYRQNYCGCKYSMEK